MSISCKTPIIHFSVSDLLEWESTVWWKCLLLHLTVRFSGPRRGIFKKAFQTVTFKHVSLMALMETPPPPLLPRQRAEITDCVCGLDWCGRVKGLQTQVYCWRSLSSTKMKQWTCL